MNRDFKGIWIPKEIWLSNLSCQEKCLWAEIHSLYDQDKQGCYASNDYLCEFLGVKERRLQEMLANLKHYGWLENLSFDGRTRLIRAVVPPEDFKPKERAPQGCRKMHLSDAEKCTPEVNFPAGQSISKRKEEKKGEIARTRDPLHSPKLKNKKEKVEMLSFGTYVELKPGDFEILCGEMGEDLVRHYIKSVDNYIPNRKEGPYKDYTAAIRSWYLKDKSKGTLPNSQKIKGMSQNPSPNQANLTENTKRVHALCDFIEDKLSQRFSSMIFFQAGPTRAVLFNKHKDFNKEYEYEMFDFEDFKQMLIKDLEVCFPGAKTILSGTGDPKVNNLVSMVAQKVKFGG